MKSFFKRILAVIGLTFIVVAFNIAYPFAAVWYIVTAQDLTAKFEDWIKKEKTNRI